MINDYKITKAIVRHLIEQRQMAYESNIHQALDVICWEWGTPELWDHYQDKDRFAELVKKVQTYLINRRS